jgi:hypothetical protein
VDIERWDDEVQKQDSGPRFCSLGVVVGEAEGMGGAAMGGAAAGTSRED